MATIINTTKMGFDYHGVTEVAAGKSVIIWTNGFPSSIGIVCKETESPDISFMVSAITDTMEDIAADGHTLIDLESAKITANKIVLCDWGIGAYQITNDAARDTLKVNWRIIRP